MKKHVVLSVEAYEAIQRVLLSNLYDGTHGPLVCEHDNHKVECEEICPKCGHACSLHFDVESTEGTTRRICCRQGCTCGTDELEHAETVRVPGATTFLFGDPSGRRSSPSPVSRTFRRQKGLAERGYKQHPVAELRGRVSAFAKAKVRCLRRQVLERDSPNLSQGIHMAFPRRWRARHGRILPRERQSQKGHRTMTKLIKNGDRVRMPNGDNGIVVQQDEVLGTAEVVPLTPHPKTISKGDRHAGNLSGACVTVHIAANLLEFPFDQSHLRFHSNGKVKAVAIRKRSQIRPSPWPATLLTMGPNPCVVFLSKVELESLIMFLERRNGENDHNERDDAFIRMSKEVDEARKALNRLGAPSGTLTEKIRGLKIDDLILTLWELAERDESTATDTPIEAACKLLRSYRSEIDDLRSRANEQIGYLQSQAKPTGTQCQSCGKCSKTEESAHPAAKQWMRLDALSLEVPLPVTDNKVPGVFVDAIWCTPAVKDQSPIQPIWSMGYWSVNEPKDPIREQYVRMELVSFWRESHSELKVRSDKRIAELEQQLKASESEAEAEVNKLMVDAVNAAKAYQHAIDNNGDEARIKSLQQDLWVQLDAIDTGLVLEAPESVVTNGHTIRMPQFVIRHLGIEDGDNVVFWANEERNTVTMASCATAADREGHASPLAEEFALEDLVGFVYDGCRNHGIVVGYDKIGSKDVLRLRMPRGETSFIDPALVFVAKLERCPHVHENGCRCELPRLHLCDHAMFDDIWVNWPRNTLAEKQATKLWGTMYAHKLCDVLREPNPKPLEEARKEAVSLADQAVADFYGRKS